MFIRHHAETFFFHQTGLYFIFYSVYTLLGGFLVTYARHVAVFQGFQRFTII